MRGIRGHGIVGAGAIVAALAWAGPAQAGCAMPAKDGPIVSIGGDVTEIIYPGMGHTVVQDEIDHVERILRSIGTSEG